MLAAAGEAGTNPLLIQAVVALVSAAAGGGLLAWRTRDQQRDALEANNERVIAGAAKEATNVLSDVLAEVRHELEECRRDRQELREKVARLEGRIEHLTNK